jgi:SAM-dependent methyltransferase
MELIERSGQDSVDVVDVRSYPANDIAAGAAAASLGALFDSYGSDKASAHDYHHFYASILQPGTPRSLLEIGLGTNNTDVVATMGAQGRPGASLRAFRDHLPGAHIFGADVDERVLFTEERIKTCRVDQIDRESFENVTAMIGGQVDVVIDDGLHAPNANLAVLHYAFDVLAPDGWLVIEDIASASVPIWQVVAALMPANFDCTIVQARDGLLFTAHRTS